MPGPDMRGVVTVMVFVCLLLVVAHRVCPFFHGAPARRPGGRAVGWAPAAPCAEGYSYRGGGGSVRRTRRDDEEGHHASATTG